MALAAPAATLTVTGSPMIVVPLRMVKVSDPSSTVPAALVTVALSGTSCGPLTKVTDAVAAAVADGGGVDHEVLTGIGESRGSWSCRCRPPG